MKHQVSNRKKVTISRLKFNLWKVWGANCPLWNLRSTKFEWSLRFGDQRKCFWKLGINIGHLKKRIENVQKIKAWTKLQKDESWGVGLAACSSPTVVSKPWAPRKPTFCPRSSLGKETAVRLWEAHNFLTGNSWNGEKRTKF